MKLLIFTVVLVSILNDFYMANVLAREDAMFEKKLCKNLLRHTIEKYSISYKDKFSSIETHSEFNSAVQFVYDDVSKLEKQSEKCIRVSSAVYGRMSTKAEFNKVMTIIREVGEVHKVTSGLRVHAEYYVSSKSNNNKKYFKNYVTMFNEYIEQHLVVLESAIKK